MAPGPRHKALLLRTFVVLLAAAGLFFAFRGVDWHEMLGIMRRARLTYLALACLVLSLSYGLRGLRWRVLLSAEKLIPASTVFWANMVGYLGNNFLPARAGELIRSVMLGQRAGISKSFVLATAITERIMDVVVLVIISAVAAVTLGNLPGWLVSATKVMGALGLACLLILYLAARSHAFLAGLLAHLPSPVGMRSRVASITEQFLAGTRAIHHPSRGLGFAGLAAAIWLMDAFSSMLGAKALSLVLTLPQALILLAALGLASALPSTPGAVGIYQLVAVTILMPFGYSRDSALAYILVAQACAYVVVTVWGLGGLWRLGAASG